MEAGYLHVSSDIVGGRENCYMDKLKKEDLQSVGHLLREEIAAVRNAAVERDGCEVGATLPFLLRPGGDPRKDRAGDSVEHIHQPVISPDNSNFVLILPAFRAQADQLQQSLEILRRHVLVRDSGGFPNAVRKLHFPRGSQDRAAIRHEELQECRNGDDADQGGNHRVLTASLAVARRASSETIANV